MSRRRRRRQRIAAYAQALLDRYPDISTQAGQDSPWSTSPLINEASGPLMYVPMVRSRCDEVSAWVPLNVVLHQGVRTALHRSLAHGFYLPVRAALAS